MLDNQTEPTGYDPADCYVYLYHNPLRKEVVYVGKGRDRRAWDHLARSHNRGLAKFVRFAASRGMSIGPVIVRGGLTSAEASELEARLIDKIGRKDLGRGPLLNRVTRHGENSKRIPVVISGVRYKSLAAASRAHGLKDTTIASRLKSGWSLDQAAGLAPPPPPPPPPKPRCNPVTVHGIAFESVSAAARHHGVNADLAKARLRLGWTADVACTKPSRTRYATAPAAGRSKRPASSSS